MIRRGKHVIKKHMTLEYNFSGIRIQSSLLTPVDWKLSVDLVATGTKEQTRDDIEYQSGITYQKIYFWLDTNLPDIVIVNVCNEDDLYLANLISNVMMYCPGNPGDDMLIQLLHSKLSVLAGSNILVSEIRLTGTDTSLQYTFDCTDGGYDLPSVTSDYYKGYIVRDESPWWSRDDGFCCEFVRDKNSETNEVEVFKDIVDPMDDFHRVMTSLSGSIASSKEPARIVQVEKWKPKKV